MLPRIDQAHRSCLPRRDTSSSVVGDAGTTYSLGVELRWFADGKCVATIVRGCMNPLSSFLNVEESVAAKQLFASLTK